MVYVNNAVRTYQTCQLSSVYCEVNRYLPVLGLSCLLRANIEYARSKLDLLPKATH